MAFVINGVEYFSIPEVARRLRVPRHAVYRWVTGRRPTPVGVSIEVIRDPYTRRAYLPHSTLMELTRALNSEAVVLIRSRLEEFERAAMGAGTQDALTIQLRERLLDVIQDKLLESYRKGLERGRAQSGVAKRPTHRLLTAHSSFSGT